MKRGTPDHPKAKALAVHLGLHRYQVVGLLESLWHFAAGYARAGDVGRFKDSEIAGFIGWEGEASDLIQKLVDTRWLDRCKCHRLRVHDWPDHADQTVSRSLKGRFLDCYRDDSSLRLVTHSESRATADPPLPLPEPLASALPEPEPCSVGLEPFEEFGQAVLGEYSKLRGFLLPEPTQRDYHQVQTWHSSGIPLRIVLRGMADCYETMRKRGDRPGEKPLAYYNSAVQEAARMWRKSQVGAA